MSKLGHIGGAEVGKICSLLQHIYESFKGEVWGMMVRVSGCLSVETPLPREQDIKGTNHLQQLCRIAELSGRACAQITLEPSWRNPREHRVNICKGIFLFLPVYTVGAKMVEIYSSLFAGRV